MPGGTPREKHDHKSLNFPKDFLWGAATSAYQVEGNNIHSDWWAWEEERPPSMRSGQAANQYELYELDFDLAKNLGHNSHRLSIEWSRIEPKEGEFDHHEIEHYQKVLKTLKDHGFIVMLTLWHFTLPKWVADKGGWENGQTAKYFARFVERVVPELKDYVDLWITINEPGTYVLMSYLGGDGTGVFPPGKKSNWSAFKATLIMARAHKKAFKIIHKLIPDAKVGITQSFNSFEAYHKHSVTEQVAVTVSDLVANHSFYWLTKKSHDFIGVNYYFHHRYKKAKGFIPKMIDAVSQRLDVSDLGWELYPEGIFEVLTDIQDDLPIYITECGIASTNDDRRVRFLLQYLHEVYRAITSGVKVKGFFYWSLIDNFEWHRGFDPRFGLIQVDYKTQERKIRNSAYVYRDIIKLNAIPHHFLKLLGHSVNVDDVLGAKDVQCKECKILLEKS